MSPLNTHRQESDIFFPIRNKWLGIALATSITLHLAAVIIVVLAVGKGDNRNKDALISVLDVSSPTTSINQLRGTTTHTTHPAPGHEVETPNHASVETVNPASVEPQIQSDAKMLATSPLGLGMTFGYVTSLAEGATLRDDIRMYYFELVAKINREWWKRAVTLREQIRHDGVIDIVLLRNGTLVTQKFRQGTGSREADRLFAEAVEAATPLPHLPENYELDFFTAPLRITAPSQLFRIGGN